jgi:hypothetical protein
MVVHNLGSTCNTVLVIVPLSASRLYKREGATLLPVVQQVGVLLVVPGSRLLRIVLHWDIPMDSLERGDIPTECYILWSKQLRSWVNLTQRLTRVVLTQVKEICQFSLLGNGISKY